MSFKPFRAKVEIERQSIFEKNMSYLLIETYIIFNNSFCKNVLKVATKWPGFCVAYFVIFSFIVIIYLLHVMYKKNNTLNPA